ncbi:hypothetical protein STRDD11_01372 [Streptococcus sp. DD11]|nr:hypothetical protein STRDD11_01372 [Streptococcus sp. DD11]
MPVVGNSSFVTCHDFILAGKKAGRKAEKPLLSGDSSKLSKNDKFPDSKSEKCYNKSR